MSKDCKGNLKKSTNKTETEKNNNAQTEAEKQKYKMADAAQVVQVKMAVINNNSTYICSC